MGTKTPVGLDTLLFGKTRRALLALFFTQPDQSFYVRQLVRASRTGQGAVQRELVKLSGAGLLVRSAAGGQVHYRANPGSPIFEEMKSLVRKTSGLEGALQSVLAGLGEKVRFALLFGSEASGKAQRGSDVDLLVVGSATFAEISALLSPLEERMNREINPVVFPLAEFRRKLEKGDHFLTSVVGGPKTFLIGKPDELARLAG